MERDVPISDSLRADAERLVKRYPVARSALLPLLHLVQSEQNHVTEEGIALCAELVGLSKAEVGAVATFYTMYKREPVGDYLLSVCTTTTCKFMGGQRILDDYVETLGGHSDPETKVTVEHAECLGICDAAPVVQVNYEMFGPLTTDEADALLDSCRKGDPPVSSWSGEKPPTFAEVERDLSGANDAFADHLIEAARQQVAYANPPAYRSGETDIPVTLAGGDPRGVGGELFRSEGGASTAGVPASAAAVATEVRDSATPGSVEAERTDQAGEPAPPATVEEPAQEPTGEVPTEATASATEPEGSGEPAEADRTDDADAPGEEA
jgi:NADH-quinone oxidoreductase subunit E